MIEFHTHEGNISPRINPKDLLGFPIFIDGPSLPDEEGKLVLGNFNSGIVGLYIRLNRQWNLMGIGGAFSDTGSLTIGGGTPITSVISNTATLNFGAIAPNTAADLTMTLTGAAIGDTIALGINDTVISSGTNCNDITFFAWVSGTNTVKVRCSNVSAANTANPASGTFRVTTIKF